jgi:hypothetical protein
MPLETSCRCWLSQLAVLFAAAALLAGCNKSNSTTTKTTGVSQTAGGLETTTAKRVFTTSDATAKPNVVVWWEGLPDHIKAATTHPKAESNIHPADYAGPESCRNCHEENYNSWSQHPHRWMNALAAETTVKGDFSGQASISYRGGTGDFFREGDNYRMRVKKNDVERVYQITQTIGSRFFQYYVGRLIKGPESPWHRFYQEDHVLPFGYWLDRQEWLPAVHLGDEMADDKRPDDPYNPPTTPGVYAPYSHACNYCHTTFPLGDLLTRNPVLIGKHAPRQLHLMLADYLKDAHPEILDSTRPAEQYADAELDAIFHRIAHSGASENGVTLGISCEACHLGSKQHVENKLKKPAFFPHSPHLSAESKGVEIDYGRTHTNVNWACGRCHSGARPQYAAGMSTWNSTEYTDAMRGSCYSELRCIDCHNPHQKIGAKWSHTADEDDASCLRCHEKYAEAEARQNHTHHPAGSEGDRCMNCHMPRINEGLQDMVRTHTIFSPTRREMIEQNHANACNLCHTKKSIDWTSKHLFDWYGKTFSLFAYKDPGAAVALGWLDSEFQAVRMTAADALTRTNARWALPELIEALDDPYLTNRQFALIGLERMLGIQLKEHGYRHYMTAEERRGPIDELRKTLLSDATESD